MTTPLRPFQITGAKWMASRRQALLADEMGLGKTPQAIHAADLVKAQRVLILCPAAARINWLREFKKFSTNNRAFDVIERSTDVPSPTHSVIASFDQAMLAWDETTGHKWEGPFDVVIADESHFLVSPTAKRTRAILGKSGLIHKGTYFWALSGTPMPNHAGELWTIFRTFGVTKLAYQQFIERYCDYYTTGYHRVQISGTKQEMIPELKEMLKKIMLRRKKKDVMRELPPISFYDMYVQAGTVPRDLLEMSFAEHFFPKDRGHELVAILDREQALVASAIDTLGVARDGMKVLEAMASSVSTLRRYIGLQKIEPALELIKGELEMDLYEKVVIFAIHKDVIESLRRGLSKFGAVTLYGGTPPEKRQKHVDKFQKDPKCRVFIGNIKAAGTAITLTAAHNVVFVEQEWTPAHNAQAAMRCHRMGQQMPVTVRVLSIAETIDEQIAYVLRRKLKVELELFDDQSENFLKEDLKNQQGDDISPTSTDNSSGVSGE